MSTSKLNTSHVLSAALFAVFLAVSSAFGVMVWIKNTVDKNRQTELRQYFFKRCAEEGGAHVFRTVENVKGVYQMRLREYKGTIFDAVRKKDLPEDPYGYTSSEATKPQYKYVNPPWGDFEFFEAPIPPEGFNSHYTYTRPGKLSPVIVDSNPSYKRYFGHVQDVSKMQEEWVGTLNSQYGFTWREVHTKEDELRGIIGSELLVVELATGEVLGVRKGFWSNLKDGFHPACPLGWDNDYTREFVKQVLLTD